MIEDRSAFIESAKCQSTGSVRSKFSTSKTFEILVVLRPASHPGIIDALVISGAPWLPRYDDQLLCLFMSVSTWGSVLCFSGTIVVSFG